MSASLSVCPSLKISVTTKPIGFYSSGNIPMVLGYFLGGVGHPQPLLNKNTPRHFFKKTKHKGKVASK